MQGFKKVLVALLVVATILGTIGPVFAAENTNAPSEAATRLQAIGIAKGDEKGNLNEDQPVTRAEAAALVVRALGMEKSAELMGGATKFADVNADPGLQWATGAINIAVSQGIINGYPDGRFGGRDQVTYAQFAKMMLYALNYGVTVEGGIWPTAVLAKADDIKLTDGLTVVANAPMIRGAVFKMVDNALDVKPLVQYGYGSSTLYQPGDQKLIQKLGYDELEAQVTAIPAADSTLKDDQVTVTLQKKNGADASGDKTYTVGQGVDVNGLFGTVAKLWVKDDTVIYAQQKTSDSDVYYDTIKSYSSSQVKLLALDKTIDLKSGVKTYVNYDGTATPAADEYGRFVKDNNQVSFINVFRFDKINGGIVTSVSDNEIKYFAGASATTRTLRLSQFDNVHVLSPKFAELSLSDVKADSVIYAWADGTDDLYIVVVGEKVEGKLDRVSTDKVRIDGKDYKVVQKADGTVLATVSTDEDVTVNSYTTDNAKGLVGEDVVALLGLNGRVQHLRGASAKTTGWNYGVVTNAYYSNGTLALKVFTKDGESVVYELEKEANWPTDNAHLNFGADNGKFYGIAYKLNSDGQIAKDKLVILPSMSGTVTLDSDTYDVYVGNVKKADKDQQYVTEDAATATRYYVDSGTVLMKVYDGTDKDPALVDWKVDLDGTTLTGSDPRQAIVVGTKDQSAKFILFTSENFQVASADYYFGVAVTDETFDSDNGYATIDVAGQGEKEYTFDSSAVSDITKGDLLAFRVTGDKAKNVTHIDVQASSLTVGATLANYGTASVGKAVYDVVQAVYNSGRYVKFSGVTYTVDADAVVYLLKSDQKFDMAGGVADIETGKHAIFLTKDNDDKLIKAIVIW